MILRLCYNCGSDKTYINNNGSFMWYKHEDGLLCNKCHCKLFINPKWVPITVPKRIWYKNKSVRLKHNPRTGQCSICLRKKGEGIKLTHMHHIQYHDDDPLKDTIEVCVSCHKKQHRLLH